MALTSDEKHDIVRVLGYPGAVLIQTSPAYSNIVASRLDNLNSAIETQARALLTRITKLDARLDGALDRVGASRVADIVMNPHEMSMLRGERKRVAREISELLDISRMNECSDSMIGIYV